MNTLTRLNCFEKYMQRIEFPINKDDMWWAIENLKPFQEYQWFMDRLKKSILEDSEIVFDKHETIDGSVIRKMPEDFESFVNYVL